MVRDVSVRHQRAGAQSRAQLIAGGLLSLWLGSLPFVTAARVPAWRDDRSLWRAAVQVTPQRPRPWIFLAVAEGGAGHLPAATEAIVRGLLALQARPSQRASLRELAYVTAATVAWQHGNRPVARHFVQRALAINPRSHGAWAIADRVGGSE